MTGVQTCALPISKGVDRKGTPEADPRKEFQTNDRRVNFAKRIPRDVILKTDNGRRAEGTERRELTEKGHPKRIRERNFKQTIAA